MSDELFVIHPVIKLTFDTRDAVRKILCKTPYGLSYKYITECIKYEVDMILKNKYYEKHKETYTQYEKRRVQANNKSSTNNQNTNNSYYKFLSLLGLRSK